MLTIVGVRFKEAGKIYHFDTGELSPEAFTIGTPLVVETVRGIEYGLVAQECKEVDEESKNQPLRKVLRIATAEDIAQHASNVQKEADARDICLEKIAAHNLEMHLVNVELTFDLSKIIFYFTADGRVDFRELVKDLAATFRMRIELRQIGVRDEAKMLNGMGICGRTLCCATFLEEFQPVSIKSAKDQGLSLNPTKISGICGKLMCCLKYEEETYAHLNIGMPGVGDKVRTLDGDGYVVSVNILRQTARVAVQDKEDTKTDTYPGTDLEILERNVQCERGCNCGNCGRHGKGQGGRHHKSHQKENNNEPT